MAAMEAALAVFENEPPPIRRRLIWDADFGIGYYPCDPDEAPYDEFYFAKYHEYMSTRMGEALNISRAGLVKRYWGDGPVVDIGIGCGAFCLHRPHTYGFDINQTAVQWLHDKDLWWNPYVDPCQAVTMWDSLEHIEHFPELIENVLNFAFVSVPVFHNEEDALQSRHFRPTEHCWYFTQTGLIRVMAELGWLCREVNCTESVLGRQSITSFAFERVNGR